MSYNGWLLVSGSMSACSSIAHFCCIWGGAGWYRFFGAGERMAGQVEQGSFKRAIITVVIAAILAMWSAYGLSGSGVISRLPFLFPWLTTITLIYLLCAASLPLMVMFMRDRGIRFLVVSSAIVFVMGSVHAIGLYVWAESN